MSSNVDQMIKWFGTFGDAPYKVIIKFLSIYLINELIKLTINWYELTVRKQIFIRNVIGNSIVINEHNEFNNKYTARNVINVINTTINNNGTINIPMISNKKKNIFNNINNTNIVIRNTVEIQIIINIFN